MCTHVTLVLKWSLCTPHFMPSHMAYWPMSQVISKPCMKHCEIQSYLICLSPESTAITDVQYVWRSQQVIGGLLNEGTLHRIKSSASPWEEAL